MSEGHKSKSGPKFPSARMLECDPYALTFVVGPSGRPAEITLQRPDLKVAPEVGLNALRRSDGT